LQLALSSITNKDLIQEIPTMLSTAKIFNTLSSSTTIAGTTATTTTTTGNIFPNTNINEQTLQRPSSISLSLNPQHLYHNSS
ncbi:unnamed protein product, partial [Rotaria magnacalcarata]